MELISYEQFGKLRMKNLVPPETAVYERDGYEWMGGFWLNEGIRGCTSVSRHEDTPDEAGGLEVDFRDLPESGVLAIFEAIHLPLRPAMTFEEVRLVLGEAEHAHVFGTDRKCYDFTVGSRCPYHVSAIIHQRDKLIYVAVVRKDVLSKCEG